MRAERGTQKAGAVTARSRSLQRMVRPFVLQWRRRAKKAFEDAAREPDEMGKRLIEHGAMCYCNAATELEAALARKKDGAAPRPSGTPAKWKTSTKPQA